MKQSMTYDNAPAERDVRQLVNVGQLRDFERCLRAVVSVLMLWCGLRSGGLFCNLSGADSRDVTTFRPTASGWTVERRPSYASFVVVPKWVSARDQHAATPFVLGKNFLYLNANEVCWSEKRLSAQHRRTKLALNLEEELTPSGIACLRRIAPEYISVGSLREQDVRAIIEALPELEGLQIETASQLGHTPQTLKVLNVQLVRDKSDLTKIGQLSQLSELSLESVHNRAEGHLEALANLRRLRRLSIKSYDLPSGHELKALRNMKALERLDLPSSKGIDENAFSNLAQLEGLKFLDLSNSYFGEGGIRGIAKLRHLEWLNLRGAEITSIDLDEIEQLRDLQSLDIGNSHIRHARLDKVAQLRKLRELRLSGITWKKGFGLNALASLPKLRMLDISKTNASEIDVEQLAGLNTLVWLDLEGCEVGRIGAKAIARQSGLRWLNLSHTQLGKHEMTSLRRLKRLEWLDLTETEWPGATLKTLGVMPELRALMVKFEGDVGVLLNFPKLKYLFLYDYNGLDVHSVSRLRYLYERGRLRQIRKILLDGAEVDYTHVETLANIMLDADVENAYNPDYDKLQFMY